MSDVELFQPLTLRDVTIGNRIWLSPMCQYSCFAGDGMPTDWHLAHLGSFAIGGFGLVMTEATAVAPQARITLHDTGIWNDVQARAWRRITDFVHAQDSAVGIQLGHGGRKASTYSPLGDNSGSLPLAEGGWRTQAPSPIALDGHATPAEMTTDDIAQVVADFAAAAARADEAGFDVVELHAAHGYLIHEFLSPLSNHRSDSYGGDLNGRARLLLDVVDAVRARLSDGTPLFVRISATEWTEGGWSVEDSVTLAHMLIERDVDIIDVSSGGNVAADIPVGPGYQVRFASHIKAKTGIGTAGVGLITEPEQAETIVSAGQADAVFLGRAALRDPAWPLRAAHSLGIDHSQAPYRPQYLRGAWRD